MKIKAGKKLIIILAVMVALSALPAAAPWSFAATGVEKPDVSYTDVLDGVRVSLSSPGGGEIYYTTYLAGDKNHPTKPDTLYDGPFVLSEAGTHTILAETRLNGRTSDVSSKTKELKSCDYDIESAKKDPSKVLEVKAENGKYLVTFAGFEGYEVFFSLGRTGRPTINDGNIKNSKIYVNKPTLINLLICKNGTAPVLLQVNATQEAWKGKKAVEMVNVEIQNFYGGKAVKFISATEGAQFRYKMSTVGTDFNGLILDESNTSLCDGDIVRIETAGTYYLKAYGVNEGMFDSDTTNLMRITVDECPKPEITIKNSAVNSNLKVVTAEVEGSDIDIYYTTDGSTPNEGSKKYSGPRTFGQHHTLKFIAMRRGSVSSGVVTKSVSGSGGDPLEKPEYSGSTSPNGIRTITLSSPNDAEIYYAITTGSATYKPEAGKDTLYTEPIVFDKNGEYYLWARAYRDGEYSALFGGKVTVKIVDGLAKPGITSETLPSGVKVVRMTTVSGNNIYYLLTPDDRDIDAETVRDEGTLYVYPITIAEASYLYAVAEDGDGNLSQIAKGRADFPTGPATPEKVGKIIAQVTADEGGALVTLDCEDSEADLFYVFDNSYDGEATVTDDEYTGEPITIVEDGYLHVLAARPGYEYNRLTERITLYKEKTADPKVTYTLVNNSTSIYKVSVSCSTPGAKFYYTTDGSYPDDRSNEFIGGGDVVPAGVTLKVIAIAPGCAPSNVFTVILSEESVESCHEVVPEMGDVLGGKVISLMSLTEGAKIYYTTNGTEPTVASLLYDSSKKIRITSEGKTVIKAIAVKNGMDDSDVTEVKVELTRFETPKVAKDRTGAVLLVAVKPETDSDGNTVIPSVYYTLDGSIPNVNSPSTYSVSPASEHQSYPGYKCAQITLSEDGIFNAVAAGEGYVTSYMYQTTIEIKDAVKLPSQGELVRTPIMGGELLEIPILTTGATLYYSLEAGNTSDVTPNKIYTGPITLTSKMNYVTVLGTKAGLVTNKIQYTIPLPQATAPTSEVPNNSAVDVGSEVTLTADNVMVSGKDAEAAIFYTLDGTVPTVESTKYEKPIEITGNTRIRAIAAAEGAVASDILELYYTVQDGEAPALTIDAEKLLIEDGLVHGSVTVAFDGIDVADKKVVAAVYCDDKLLQAVSVVPDGNVDSLDLTDFQAVTESDSSVIVKAFVFEGSDSLAPVCKSALCIK